MSLDLKGFSPAWAFTAGRGCVNSSDSFCYNCGELVVKKQQRNIADIVRYKSRRPGQPIGLCKANVKCKAMHWTQKMWASRTLEVEEKNADSGHQENIRDSTSHQEGTQKAVFLE